jgi:hypothetical protein
MTNVVSKISAAFFKNICPTPERSLDLPKEPAFFVK